MKDLFEREQQIYEEAVLHMEEANKGGFLDFEKYALLVKEYGRLLKQLRRFTKISDRTTVDLNASKLDLLDKVHYDALTGIFNRRFLEEKMQKLSGDILRDGGCWLGMLMVDIDFFKRFNDTFGHQAGDECLRRVALSLKESVTGKDAFVARYGGEEFIVVLPNADEEETSQTAGRLLEHVRKCCCRPEKDGSGGVTVSVGATTGRVELESDPEEYIKRADQALYESKRAGRDRYTFLKM